MITLVNSDFNLSGFSVNANDPYHHPSPAADSYYVTHSNSNDPILSDHPQPPSGPGPAFKRELLDPPSLSEIVNPFLRSQPTSGASNTVNGAAKAKERAEGEDGWVPIFKPRAGLAIKKKRR